jgi:hypothetical protein
MCECEHVFDGDGDGDGDGGCVCVVKYATRQMYDNSTTSVHPDTNTRLPVYLYMTERLTSSLTSSRAPFSSSLAWNQAAAAAAAVVPVAMMMAMS